MLRKETCVSAIRRTAMRFLSRKETISQNFFKTKGRWPTAVPSGSGSRHLSLTSDLAVSLCGAAAFTDSATSPAMTNPRIFTDK